MSGPLRDPDVPVDVPIDNATPNNVSFWLDDGQIYVVRPRSSVHQSFDQWETNIRGVLDNWPPERTLAMLFDFRNPQFGMTLHSGTRLRRLGLDYAHLHVATAIVVTNTLRARSIVAAINLIPLSKRTARQFFTDYDQALAWLRALRAESEGFGSA